MSDLFDQLTSISAIEALIAGGIRESDVLEYKVASKPFNDRDKAELAKDVTGMANSLGGLIIYGVATHATDKTLPQSLTPVDVKNVETVDRVINSQIRPPIAGLRKRAIPEVDPLVLLLDVPESQEPPHQNLYDRRYYRRSGTECLPMEHDLVALKFGRRLTPVLDLVIQPISSPDSFEGEPAWTNSARVSLFIHNIGRRVGRDVQTVLQLPPATLAQVRDVRGNLVNIDALYPGIQARQFGYHTSVYHPGMKTSVAELDFRFAKTPSTLMPDSPLIEWTLLADEMSPRTGVVTLASLGWVLPR